MKAQGKIIAISIIGLSFVVALHFLIISPMLKKVSELRGQLITKKSDLKQMEAQIVVYNNSKQDLSQASGTDLIADGLLKREDLKFAIEEIEAAAAKTSVEESMTISEQTNTKVAAKGLIKGKLNLDEVNYNLKTTSDFVELINFIKYLENLPHFTEIGHLTLSATEGSAGSNGVFVHTGNIGASIDAVFFVQKNATTK